MPFHLTGGVLAGAVAAIATSPIDAIKTRMQASTHPRLALLGARPVTLLPCCLQVYGRGAGIAATAAAMLRGHGTAAFTRLTPPPYPHCHGFGCDTRASVTTSLHSSVGQSP